MAMAGNVPLQVGKKKKHLRACLLRIIFDQSECLGWKDSTPNTSVLKACHSKKISLSSFFFFFFVYTHYNSVFDVRGDHLSLPLLPFFLVFKKTGPCHPRRQATRSCSISDQVLFCVVALGDPLQQQERRGGICQRPKRNGGPSGSSLCFGRRRWGWHGHVLFRPSGEL